jgi:hypothetical protein
MQGTGQVRIRAHYRADGTYVRSHYRSLESMTASTDSTGFDLTWLWYVLLALLILGTLSAVG